MTKAGTGLNILGRCRSYRKAAYNGFYMISNERPSPHGQRHHEYAHHKPHVPEQTLKMEKIQIERKTFIFTLKENPRGRFLRITEDVGGRRDMVIVPVTGLDDFRRMLDEMAKAAREMPPASPPQQGPSAGSTGTGQPPDQTSGH